MLDDEEANLGGMVIVARKIMYEDGCGRKPSDSESRRVLDKCGWHSDVDDG
jgi:hypothetical protein